ncbi:MAG: hypothetical protein ABI807_05315 [Sporichthyaceae bacterium]
MTGAPRRSGPDDLLRNRGLGVSAATAAGALFTLYDYTPLNFAQVDGRIAVLLLVLGVVGAAGAVLGRGVVLVGVGAVLLLLAFVRLVTYGHGDGLIGGGSSTAALFAGLGLAHLGIAVAARPLAAAERDRRDPG